MAFVFKVGSFTHAYTERGKEKEIAWLSAEYHYLKRVASLDVVIGIGGLVGGKYAFLHF